MCVQVPQEAQKDVGAHGAGVTGGANHLIRVLGTELMSSLRVERAPNDHLQPNLPYLSSGNLKTLKNIQMWLRLQM